MTQTSPTWVCFVTDRGGLKEKTRETTSFLFGFLFHSKGYPNLKTRDPRLKITKILLYFWGI